MAGVILALVRESGGLFPVSVLGQLRVLVPGDFPVLQGEASYGFDLFLAEGTAGVWLEGVGQRQVYRGFGGK